MKTESNPFRIIELKKIYQSIEYPEFQREPNIWSKEKKQLLIDSILREFDIGSVYLLESEEGHFQCIDGRQRLSALFSFIGINPDDEDNEFVFKQSNEVREDDAFKDIEGCRYKDKKFNRYRNAFHKYEVRIVRISDVDDETDLNLQFQRLQVAQILNAAEKLNAMVGEMREKIFGSGEIGKLDYFRKLGTRNTRYGCQQTASQVMINAVSLFKKEDFTPARFVDMQVFFKENYRISKQTEQICSAVVSAAEELVKLIGKRNLKRIKNRALGVSILLFKMWHNFKETYAQTQWKQLSSFIRNVSDELDRARRIPIGEDPTDWQRLQLAITQASVEKRALKARHDILTLKFNEFLRKING